MALKSLEANYLLLFIAGMHPNDSFKISVNKIMHWMNAIMNLHTVLLLVSEFIYIAICWPNVEICATIIGPLWLHVEGFFKWFWFVVMAKEIKVFREFFQNCNQTSATFFMIDQTRGCSQFHKIFSSHRRQSRILTSIWVSACMYGFLHWCINPLLLQSFYNYKSIDLINATTNISGHSRNLPFVGWMPYSNDSLMLYVLVYYIQSVGGFSSVMITCIFDAYYWGVLIMICAHAKYLDFTIRQYVKENNHIHISYVEMIKKCINYHQFILRLVKKVEDIFWPVILLQTSKTLFALCNVALQATKITGAGSAMKVWSLAEYFGCVTTQYFLFCWYADSLREALFSVKNAIYSCDWPDGNLSFKKTVIFMLQISQKEVFISASPFNILNMETFKNLLTLSFSYFTVLSKITE